ncbi:MAG: BrnT family toxin, partial [Chromatiaceae bacterium]|nr:BrnT family toxin [Candidatus Thioaporhodococcus sediminis]
GRDVSSHRACYVSNLCMHLVMRIEFDPAKNSWNVQARGLLFGRVGEFDFETAYRDYGEVRFRALGLLEGRPHALVPTVLADGIRVISLRKANRREVVLYESQTQI